MIEPPWLAWAWRELAAGVREIPGPEHHPRILEYFKICRASWVHDDETSWCAAALGAGLVETIAATLPVGPLRARSYLAWGASLDLRWPPIGAIAVFARGSGVQPGPGVIDAPGHVGLVLARTRETVLVLGANQGDAWSVRSFPASPLLGVRWP